ncbi:hypothetical protein [Halosolutus halophilus]|uniref:hypothetical protein n=1 Tax=Halosolutus halophilus TaxID=1552990 RepID=UPI0022350F41|nr:hypothetical protein [Halosolutus halophilus]
MHQFELDPGLTLLRTESPRSTIVHRLACGRLANADGPAYWIDARNTAATHALYDCVSRPRVLDDLKIARAFTAYQHHSLVRTVTRRASPDTDLLVAPNVAALYRDDDVAEWEREDLLAASLETLSELGRVLDCPVLVTSATDADGNRIAEVAETTIECVRTREGVRLESADGDRVTEGYWHGDYWQTTIPYWVDLCGAVDAIDPVAAHDRGLLEVTG